MRHFLNFLFLSTILAAALPGVNPKNLEQESVVFKKNKEPILQDFQAQPEIWSRTEKQYPYDFDRWFCAYIAQMKEVHRSFGYVCPNSETVESIVQFLLKEKVESVLSIASGSGFTEGLLERHGINIISTDVEPPKTLWILRK